MVSGGFTTGMILPVCGLILTLLPCEIHSAFSDAIFEEVPLQGTRLELYETGYGGSSSLQCGMMCSVRRQSSSGCQGFRFDPQEKTYQFYQPSTSVVASSNLHVFQFKVFDVFHKVAVGEMQMSIYGSSQKGSHLVSRDRCHEVGGHLLEFNSLADYDAIWKVLAGSPQKIFHIGYNDEANEGVWVGDRDNSPINDPTLLSWQPGNPDNYAGSEHCAVLVLHTDTNRILIGDVRCSNNYPALCRRTD